MYLQGITVSVNYGDYLDHAARINKDLLNRWVIVTVPRDKETIEVCQRHGLEYTFSDRVSQNGEFHKGKAINDGLKELDKDKWTVHLDADTVLMPEQFKTIVEQSKFEKDHLYSMYGRLQVVDSNQMEVWLERNLNAQTVVPILYEVHMLVGYFQMWHRSQSLYYPEEWNTAGGDDVAFRDQFGDRVRLLNTYSIHLGPRFTDHGGRKSPRFK